MLRALVKSVLTLVLFAALVYVAVEVPLGERTLYEHIRRIVATAPAQDFGRDVRTAGDRAVKALETKVRELRAQQRDGGDAH